MGVAFVTGYNVTVDLSHNNGSVDLAAASAGGVRAVIHKATEGMGYTDPMYAKRAAQAQAAGLLWGAYHFATGSDAAGQAKDFLAAVFPSGRAVGPATLLVLDLERNSGGSTMTVAQARDFVTAVHDQTGVWPGLYAGSYLKEQLNGKADPVLSNCWLWLAQYGSTPQSPVGWSEWTLWQYTDGKSGSEPHTAPGIGACDRDTFNGDAAAFDAFWARNALSALPAMA